MKRDGTAVKIVLAQIAAFFNAGKERKKVMELQELKQESLSQIEACENLADLQQLRVLYLGKKGPIQEVMKSMKDLPKEERPAFGQQVNAIKSLILEAIDEKRRSWKSKRWKKDWKRKRSILP